MIIPPYSSIKQSQTLLKWKKLFLILSLISISSSTSAIPKHNIILPLHQQTSNSITCPIPQHETNDTNIINIENDDAELISSSSTLIERSSFAMISSSSGSIISSLNSSYSTTLNETITSNREGGVVSYKSIEIKDDSSISKTSTAKKRKIKRVKKIKTTRKLSKQECIENESLLRRLKSEWKNMITQGVAYRWDTMSTIQPKKPNNITSHSKYVRLGPFQNNLLIWHFTITGPANSPYSKGLYHGRILLPKNYPASPPRIQMITPSGRFQPGVDICLSASNYHPEDWTPRWTILGIIDALRLHMLTVCNEIGGMDATEEERRRLALVSNVWRVCIGGSFGKGVVVDHSRMVSLFFESDDDESGNDAKVAFVPQLTKTETKKKKTE